MRVTGSEVVSVELDSALVTVERIALGGGHDLTPAEAQALMVDRERLRAIEQRLRDVLASLNRTTSAHAVAREILGEA